MKKNRRFADLETCRRYPEGLYRVLDIDDESAWACDKRLFVGKLCTIVGRADMGIPANKTVACDVEFLSPVEYGWGVLDYLFSCSLKLDLVQEVYHG